MDPTKRKTKLRQKRHHHVRRIVEGTPERPRMCVFRSNRHIQVQVIDDWKGNTLLSVSTDSPELREELEKTNTIDAAAKVGTLIGKKCLDNDITKVVFDRGGYKYHGRVKALAEAARKCFEEAGAEGF
ncbi:MAG: 50S ribosomal protein L18 [Candidatus Brocadiia bacterium]